MILSDYECLDCKEVFEQLIDKDEKPKCPNCEGSDIQLLLNFGGYSVNGDNSCSTSSRGSGSFRGRKK